MTVKQFLARLNMASTIDHVNLMEGSQLIYAMTRRMVVNREFECWEKRKINSFTITGNEIFIYMKLETVPITDR